MLATSRVVLLLMLLASPACAGEVEPKIPTRLGCIVVRALHRHWAREGYTVEQMKDYMRHKGISEARVAGAEKCLS
jgi:hypothetical protein